MKKAKMMLTGIAVLAVVGGALAFKAKNFNHWDLYMCTTTAGGGGNLYCVLEPYATTDLDGGSPTNIPPVSFYTTISDAGACSVLGNPTAFCTSHPDAAAKIFINQ